MTNKLTKESMARCASYGHLLKEGLKPCPFCGSKRDRRFNETVNSETRSITPVIECGHCGAQGGYGVTAEDAVKYWNIRDKPWG